MIRLSPQELVYSHESSTILLHLPLYFWSMVISPIHPYPAVESILAVGISICGQIWTGLEQLTSGAKFGHAMTITLYEQM